MDIEQLLDSVRESDLPSEYLVYTLVDQAKLLIDSMWLGIDEENHIAENCSLRVTFLSTDGSLHEWDEQFEIHTDNIYRLVFHYLDAAYWLCRNRESASYRSIYPHIETYRRQASWCDSTSDFNDSSEDSMARYFDAFERFRKRHHDSFHFEFERFKYDVHVTIGLFAKGKDTGIDVDAVFEPILNDLTYRSPQEERVVTCLLGYSHAKSKTEISTSVDGVGSKKVIQILPNLVRDGILLVDASGKTNRLYIHPALRKQHLALIQEANDG